MSNRTDNRRRRSSGRAPRPGRLQRLGSACARRPLVVLALWLLALGGVVVGSRAAGGTFSDNITLSGTQAYTGSQLLKASDRAASGYTGLVVIHSAAGPVAADSTAIHQAQANLARLPHVVSVTDPLSPHTPAVSPSGRIAYLTVHLNVVPKSLGSSYATRLDAATAPLRQSGLEVAYGGDFDQVTRPPAQDARSEVIGFTVALVVLLIGFGSVVAAVLPLLTALFSVLVGTGLLTLVAAVITFGTASPTLALMIGLGVGIDYAVFLTTRFRQRLMAGAAPDEAAGSTAATSGHAILIAAGTVTVALFGLYASGIAFLGTLGFAAVFGVVTAAVGAVTLVPACLGLVGRRIDRFTVRTAVAETGSAGDGWHRY
ncbi:MAG TPA: MMPL family transporter, partial [Candidatus Dormibacteraeota bacterium]|nr:MMPL family transporter [Candidatus Dormibacteraeota bacterium]